MRLQQRPVVDLDALCCPHCPALGSLDLALRVDVEAEASIFVVACRACERFYRVQPEVEDGGWRAAVEEIVLRQVRCPRCATEGHAIHCDLPRDRVESYTLITCRTCQLTFEVGEFEAAS